MNTLQDYKSFRGYPENVLHVLLFLYRSFYAMQAINAFFENRSMSDYVDFTSGLPDSDILVFPEEFVSDIKNHTNLSFIKKQKVQVPEDLRNELRDLVDYLKSNSSDLDFIDYDDAIQIGKLCGGRETRKSNCIHLLFIVITENVGNLQIQSMHLKHMQIMHLQISK